MDEILIGADFVPTSTNEKYFSDGDIEVLLGMDLITVLQNAQFRIFNLETPLCDTDQPIPKIGPNLVAKCKTAIGFQKAKVDFFTLANNHILDQDAEGLRTTRETLDSMGIAYAGAGASLADAAKPFVFSYKGQMVGIYCCAEHEFTIAGENRPGANPFDPLCSLDHISTLKERCDYLIVLYHGGKEHYRYPSPQLKRICHSLVNKGADLVVCQHTHCVGCEERYQNGVIVYGQGNFLFDSQDNEFWNSGLLIQVGLEQNKWEVSYLPLRKTGVAVRLAEGTDADEIMSGFWRRTEEIKSYGFVERTYDEFAEQYLNYYLQYISGRESFVFRVLNRLTNRRLRKWMLSKRFDKYHLLCIRDFSECEAHRELLLRGINLKAGIK